MFFNKKAKDPVCGMGIKVNSSTLRSHYQGTEYYFCSPKCLEQFEKESQKYIVASKGCCGKAHHSAH